MTDIRTLMESINSILNESMGNPLSFEELCQRRNDLGIVVLGAGGQISEWAEGISKMLVEEGISETLSVFSEYGVVTGNLKGPNGRTDAYFFFNKGNKIDMGKLAMWRLRFGDASWVEDFCDNYRRDYEEGYSHDEGYQLGSDEE